MDTHLSFLRQTMFGLLRHYQTPLTLPTLFEYYTAYCFSIEHNQPFYVWKDVSPLKKREYHIPNNDAGIDCTSDDFSKLVQCKYYSEQTTITYGVLATFLAFLHFFPREQQFTFYLSRTVECKLSEYVRNIIARNNLIEWTTQKESLVENCKEICNELMDVDEEKQEFVLRPPQLEALAILHKSMLVGEKKNVILQIPTGVGKTIVALEFARQTGCCMLVLVPTIILMEQWCQEAIGYGFHQDVICMIGTNHTHDIQLENKKIVICVYNSVQLVLDDLEMFDKIFIDEAHHIRLPRIYQDLDENVADYNEQEESDTDDEVEDEVGDNEESNDETYIQKIKNIIHSSDKCVLMSATIDRVHSYHNYSYSLRDAIDNGYLCDYQLICPIFSDSPSDKQIAEYLIRQGELHCIVFCNSIEHCEEFTSLLNELLPNCANAIHSDIPKLEREWVLQQYSHGNIRFLVNVRVLVEGFDSKITSSCVFLHLPSNDTFIVQAIGRCLRVCPNKLLANVYIPFSTNEDGRNISTFITELSKNDRNISQAYVKREIGSYINLQMVRKEKENNENEVLQVEFRYNVIYNSLGMEIDGIEQWSKRLEQVKEFIHQYNRRPSYGSKNQEEKTLGLWIYNQTQNYKKQAYIMKEEEIRNKWKQFVEQYSELFMVGKEAWCQSFQNVKEFIQQYHKRPTHHSKNQEEKKLGVWICTQIKNYKKQAQIMKEEEIRNEWNRFVEQYGELFMDGKEAWYQSFQKVKEFIQQYNKRPSYGSKNQEEKTLSKWVSHQIKNYKKQAQIMKEEEIRNEWNRFVEQYCELFMDGKEAWYQSFQKVKEFIQQYHKQPSDKSKNQDEKTLGLWISKQIKGYKYKLWIMKIEDIRIEWERFVEAITSYLYKEL